MKKLKMIGLFLALWGTVSAQSGKIGQQIPKKTDGKAGKYKEAATDFKNGRCGTMEVYENGLKKGAGMPDLDRLERFMEKKVAELRLLEKTGKVKFDVIKIPYIVHVIHNGEAVGTGTNLSAAQVYSQMDVLNEDFRRLNADAANTDADFKPVAGDSEIEFVPAVVAPDGSPLEERGIHRYKGSMPAWSDTNLEAILKPATSYDPNLYFNIWTVKFERNDLLGYAQFPNLTGLGGLNADNGAGNTDGVVIGYKFFGSSKKGSFPLLEAPFDLGRTLTHEVGHCFGLRHIWGDGGCGASDFVDDTPPAAGPHNGCPAPNTSSCGTESMFQNYMDYSDDRCLNLFTKGQVDRMRIVFQNSPFRKTLPDSPVDNPANMLANFTAANNMMCSGGSANFSDKSYAKSGDPVTAWAWEFEGGTPAQSSAQNPNVSYSAAGTFDVKLTVTAASGAKNTFTRKDYIQVRALAAAKQVSQNFDGTFLPAGWQQDGPWAASTSNAGTAAGGSAMINGKANANMEAIISLPSIDVKNVKVVELRFDYAYAGGLDASGTPVYDDFEIGFAKNCSGGIESTRYWGKDIETKNPMAGLFAPSAQDWKSENLYIEIEPGLEQLAFFFKANTKGGNAFYLDNVQLIPYATRLPIDIDFFSNKRESCFNEPIRFEDASVNYDRTTDITAYAWVFENGTPATSNLKKPNVSFSAPGKYDVTLKITRGSFDTTIVKRDYINITAFDGAQNTLAMDFEKVADLKNWEIENAGQDGAFVALEIGAGGSKQSFVFNNADVDYNKKDVYLKSPVVDVSGINTNLALTFDLAYGPFSNAFIDSLEVLYNGVDCGVKMVSAWKKGGLGLSTIGGYYPDSFIPKPGDWKKIYVFAKNSQNIDDIQFKFRNVGGWGNNIFIDNIKLQEMKILPVALDMRPSKAVPCAGEQITFDNLSENFADNPVLSWEWVFEGGTPATSSEKSPKVVYAQKGVYDVSLRVKRSDFDTTVVWNDFMTVKDFIAGAGFTAVGFENAADSYHEIFNETGGEGLSVANVGNNSAKSFMFDNFDKDFSDKETYFTTPVLDASAFKDFIKVSFDIAYSPIWDKYADSLEVLYVSGCDGAEKRLYYAGGYDLGSTKPVDALLIPNTSAHWARREMFIKGGAGMEQIRLKFRNIGVFGQALYIDNIKIENVTDLPIYVDIAPEGSAVVCEGGSVKIKDVSKNTSTAAITGYLWTFPGGNPATSNLARPSVTYAAQGVYDVTLKVTRGVYSETKTFKEFVQVKKTAAAQTGLDESFTGANFDQWKTYYANKAEKGGISIKNLGGAQGNALVFDNHNFKMLGEGAYAVSPTITLETTKKKTLLLMDVAYAPSVLENLDSLVIYYTTDCHQTWKRLAALGSDSLATVSNTSDEFTPKAGEWKTRKLDITDILLSSNDPTVNVQFVLANKGAYVNRIFVDNLKIQRAVLATEESISENQLVVYPNPASSELTVKTGKLEILSLALVDMMGRTVSKQQTSGTSAQISLEGIQNGLYIVVVQTAEGLSQKRVSVIK